MIQEILSKLPPSVTRGVRVRIMDCYPDRRSAKRRALGRYVHSARRVDIFRPGLPGMEWLPYAIAHEFGHRYAKLNGKDVGGDKEELFAHKWALQFVTLPG